MSISIIGFNELEATGDGNGDRTYRVTYKSRASAAPTLITSNDVSAAVIAYSGIDIGTSCPSDSTAYCQSVRSKCARRIDRASPLWDWETTFEFSSKVDANKPDGPTKEKDPTQRMPVISITSHHYDHPVDRDIFDTQIVNSAKDPIVRTKKRGRIVFHWSRYVSTWDWQNNLEAIEGNDPVNINAPGFLYSRNGRAWKPAGPYTRLLGVAEVTAGKARIDDIRTELSFENGGVVKVSMDISTDDDYFYDNVVDQGLFRLVVPNVWQPAGAAQIAMPSTVRRRFVDANGHPVGPQPLDGAGNALQPDAAPVTLSFQYYYQRRWDIAPLGGVGGYFS